MIHEALIEPIREEFDTGGFLYLAWIIPYAVVTLLIAIIMLPWLRTLEPSLRWGFILAGAIFVLGGIGLEAIGGAVLESGGDDLQSTGFTVTTTIEEALEMAGVIIAIRTLLVELSERCGVQLSLRS